MQANVLATTLTPPAAAALMSALPREGTTGTFELPVRNETALATALPDASASDTAAADTGARNYTVGRDRRRNRRLPDVAFRARVANCVHDADNDV